MSQKTEAERTTPKEGNESVHQCAGLVVNVPSFFNDNEFMDWLNAGVADGAQSPVMSWHKGGQATEWSDVMVLVDPSLGGEGPDSDMPQHIWDQIMTICRDADLPKFSNHIAVRLTNLGE